MKKNVNDVKMMENYVKMMRHMKSYKNIMQNDENT